MNLYFDLNPLSLALTVGEEDEQEANYELAVAPDEEQPEPAPYEIAVDINYEHVMVKDDEGTHSRELPRLKPHPQNYEIPVMLTQPSPHTAEPRPPVPPHRRIGCIANTGKSTL